MRWFSVFLLFMVAGCGEEQPAVYARPGDPVPGADSAQFARGRALFMRDFTAAGGLGPLFNENSCASCHDVPAIGGMGAEFVTKATRFENGRCELLTDEGGDLVQAHATPQLMAHGVEREAIPPRATAIVRILAPALYGLGLIDAIPEDEILARVDSTDRDRDGISGRPGPRAADGSIGRFGRKATFPTLRSFVVGALQGEMGITTPDAPREELVNGKPLPPGTDPLSEPELPEQQLTTLLDFLNRLAAPAAEEPATPATYDSISAGHKLFDRAGCNACHTESLRTRNQGRVNLYSDLLLHDLGTDLASICARDVSPSEWRTTPLMGVRFRHAFLHDGRAQSLTSAIGFHGGEANASRTRFQRLPPDQQELLLRFLRSL